MEQRKSGIAELLNQNIVYAVSVFIILAIVLWGFLLPQSFETFAKVLFSSLTMYFGWGYMLSMNIFVLFCIFIGFSRFSKVRLGPQDSRPEYSNFSWFAMLFSAGMGVGLVFYGAAEPLTYFYSVPFGVEPGSVQAARDAMRVSFFHWGLHPWAGYVVIAMPLAYYQFRRNAPGLISTIFIPLVGEERVRGIFGKCVDIFAIFATVAGITTSLGLGTLQLNSGLNALFGVPKNMSVQILLIALLALGYMTSALLGLERGIKNLSNINIFLCFLLMLGLFVVGPSLSIVNSLMTGVGDYFSNLCNESFMMAPYGGPYEAHLKNWTLYYWAWWIAWAPFVGSFIARVSRGRTIREFILGCLFIPALGSFTWFAIFGTSALHLELVQGVKIANDIIKDVSVGAFELYRHYPLGTIMSYIMLILISTFFVTSADSGTFVLGMYSTQGILNPPRTRTAIWGILMGALAVVLLITGGLQNLQTISLTAAPPFAVIMLCSCAALYKGLCDEERKGEI